MDSRVASKGRLLFNNALHHAIPLRKGVNSFKTFMAYKGVLMIRDDEVCQQAQW